jgi:DNA-binding PadR family transcriptional regulator
MGSPRLSPQTGQVLGEFVSTPSRWRYGYDLMKATGIAAGTLYPILARLEDCGWLESEWEPPVESGRPPRRTYRLTANGRAGAREMITRLAAMRPSPRRA